MSTKDETNNSGIKVEKMILTKKDSISMAITLVFHPIINLTFSHQIWIQ